MAGGWFQLTYEPVQLPITGASGTVWGGAHVNVSDIESHVVLKVCAAGTVGHSATLSAHEARLLAQALTALADKIDPRSPAAEGFVDDQECPF